MAEVLAVVASVIAVIQITGKVANICKYYIESVQGCPSQLRAILLETSMLRTLFKTLKLLLDSKSISESFRSLAGKDGPIEGCKTSMVELDKLFPEDATQRQSQQGRKKKRKLTVTLAALAWPFKEKQAKILLEEISHYKTTISLFITTESLQDIKAIRTQTSSIQNMLTETERHEVFKWIQTTDPSSLHNRARSLYEPGTGDWMLRFPEWADWLGAKHRCLWIHGIPGAGKTILMSHLNDHAKNHSKNSPRTAHAYYYCYFGHNQEESLPFLRSILNQLGRQSGRVTETLYKMYKNGGEPSLFEVYEALKEVLDSFDNVYIIIDALDESVSREKLLKALRHLLTNNAFQKIQLMASSREYSDIEVAMEDVSKAVSMANPYVREDIRHHVRSLITSNSNFKRWPQDILNEVERAVSTGAQGMFRWAVCQIDILQRLKSERRIVQAALANLPKTLDETYDRVLLAIPREEQLFVYHALHWISFHGDVYHDFIIPPSIALQAAEHSMNEVTKKATPMFYDMVTLKRFCGCLINLDTQGLGVTFAHYTVKEYLNRTKICQDVSAPLTRQFFLNIIFTKTLQLHPEGFCNPYHDREGSVDGGEDSTDFPQYCAISSMVSLRKWKSEIAKQIPSLAVDLLDPARSHFVPLMEMLENAHGSMQYHDALKKSDTHDLWEVKWGPGVSNMEVMHFFNLLFATGVEGDILGLVKTFLNRQPRRDDFFRAQIACTPLIVGYEFSGTCMEVLPQYIYYLSVEYGYSRKDIFSYLLQQYPEAKCDIAMYIAIHDHQNNCHNFCPLEHLLSIGGDPNGSGHQISPLQLAVKNGDLFGVEALLKAGADPNGTGDPNGRKWKSREPLSYMNRLEGTSPLTMIRARILQIGANDLCSKMENVFSQYGARDFRAIS